MIADLVAAHWNDALTILTAGVAAYTGYHQIQHYRAQQADLNIVSIDDATYVARGTNAYGSPVSVEDVDDEEIRDTKYSLEVVVENDGREPTTLSEFSLVVPNSGEEFSLNNNRTQTGWRQSFVELDGNDRRQLSLFNSGDIRDEYGDDIEAVLRIDSTAGVVEETVTLQYSG